MSFTGSARRLWRHTRTPHAWLRWLLLIPVVTVLVAASWVVVAAWYCLFGLLMVPYRLMRRGSRKRKLEALRHREIMGR